MKTRSFFVILSFLTLAIIFTFTKKKHLPIKENLFSKAFVISLDRTPERWQTAKEILLKSGLKEEQIERFSATDGYNIKIYDYQTKKYFTGKELKEKKFTFVHKNKYKIFCDNNVFFDYTAFDVYANPTEIYWGSEKEFLYNSKFMSPGEFGCTCSHLRALNEAKKRNYDNILVFEDDMLIPKKRAKDFNLNQFFTDNITELNSCGDITFLYSYLLYSKRHVDDLKFTHAKDLKVKLFNLFNRKKIINYLDTYYDDFYVTVSYLANKNLINKMISFKEINIPIDRLYSKLIFNTKEIKGCFVQPALFEHPDIFTASTISEMGRSNG